MICQYKMSQTSIDNAHVLACPCLTEEHQLMVSLRGAGIRSSTLLCTPRILAATPGAQLRYIRLERCSVGCGH